MNRELGKQKFRTIAERWQETVVHRERTETNVERSAFIAPSTFATPWNVCTSRPEDGSQ
ncbi:hypothetical protein [Streptomyces sp. RB17]|uniref:hypothetical protein n=1 Tax=Streptomyces sp. RB17 TaxID=2585197 RepID=UPI0018868562|nr:hypothetical protein [Streptomyces sp. RB17]